MNKYQCRELADKITHSEMNEMFERAKIGIKDWTKVSRLNKSFSMGAMWNVLYGAFKQCEFRYLNGIGKRNMIFEFQDFLPEHLIPAKKEKNKSEIKITHQEPRF